MIWLKRLLPLVVLALIWFGYSWLRDKRDAQLVEQDRRNALITAQVWAASAKYRAFPDSFITYRDSILAANNTDEEAMFRHVESFRDDYEHYLEYSQRVNKLVDSLTKIDDSLRKANRAAPSVPTTASNAAADTSRPRLIVR